MRTVLNKVLLLLTAATLWTSAQAAEPQPAPREAAAAASPDKHPQADGTAPAPGSVARQLMLANRLRAIQGSSLTAAISHNRAEWESLSPDQKERFRHDALAFLNEPPEQQQHLLEQYEKLIALSAAQQEHYRQMAQWLKVVTDSFTPADARPCWKCRPNSEPRPSWNARIN